MNAQVSISPWCILLAGGGYLIAGWKGAAAGLVVGFLIGTARGNQL